MQRKRQWWIYLFFKKRREERKKKEEARKGQTGRKKAPWRESSSSKHPDVATMIPALFSSGIVREDIAWGILFRPLSPCLSIRHTVERKGGKKKLHSPLHTGTVNVLHSTGQPVPFLDTRLDKLVNELCELCGWTRHKHHAVCFLFFVFCCCVSMISLPPSPLFPCLRTIHLFLP